MDTEKAIRGETALARTLKWTITALIPICLAVILIILKFKNASVISLLLDVVFLLIAYVAVICDIKEKRIPNKLVLALLISWLLVLLPQFLLRREVAVQLMLYGGLGFLINGVLLLLVYYISRKALGGGDVKLMTVAGLFLGPPILNAMLYGSVIAAIVSIVLILTKKMNKKDSIPLIPFLYAGIVITMFLQ